MDLEKKHLKELDWSILFILLGLGLFSYLGISGSAAGEQIANKQVLWYCFGYLILFLSLLIDYRLFRGLSYFLYGIGIVLLLGVFFTPEINNATSWYDLGPVLFQPSEIMKLFTILTVAHYMAKKEETSQLFEKFYQLLPICLIVGVPLLLILKQPDLGTSLVFTGILAMMLVTGGIRLRHIVGLGALIVSFFGAMTYFYHFHRDEIFFKIIKEYQWERITFWLNPDIDPMDGGFQLKQSLIAIGSGQLTGKGFETATQASLKWVPVGESDFIFTVIAERMGFIGAGLLMILFFFLIYRIIRIAMETKDPFGSYVVSGVVGMLTFQVFENIGMTIQLMPITGIPLPFISYGGSSLLTNFLVMGIVLNIGMRKHSLRFD